MQSIHIQRPGIEPGTSAVLRPRHNQLDHLCLHINVYKTIHITYLQNIHINLTYSYIPSQKHTILCNILILFFSQQLIIFASSHTSQDERANILCITPRLQLKTILYSILIFQLRRPVSHCCNNTCELLLFIHTIAIAHE